MIVAENPVTPSDAREAIRLFRDAVNQIRLLQRSAIPRWSDGMTTWFADERPPEEREEFLLYNDAELERYREARDSLQQSIEMNPYFPDAYVLLGNAYSEIDGDIDAMLRYYDDAISLDPDNDEFHNARMTHHLSTGDLDQALIDLEHLERLQSGYAQSMREHYEEARDGG
jgi:tetratricopeptide (TPR) repeat protein